MTSTEENSSVQFLDLLRCKNFFCKIRQITPSPFLDSCCVVSEQDVAFFYLLPSNSDVVKPVWQSPSKVHRCLFSEDGKNILAVLKVNSLQIYSAADKNVTLSVQIKASELSKMFQAFNIDFSAACKVVPIAFGKHKMILLLNDKSLVNIEWSFIEPPKVVYSIPVEHCKDILVGEKFSFVLNVAGVIYVYDNLTGEKRFADLNVCSPSVGQSFFKVSFRSESFIMAVVNEAQETILLDTSEIFGDTENSSKTALNETKRDKWTWPYKNLRARSGLKESNTYKVLGKVPSPPGLVVSHLQFSIRGLFAFYSILGQTNSSSFKVIDECSAVALYTFDGLIESRVINGGALPLVVTDSTLSACLGALSNDYFAVKLSGVVSDLGITKELERSLLLQPRRGPLNYHNTFFKIVLRLHVNLFCGGLKALREKRENESASREVDFCERQITDNVCELFKVVRDCKADEEGKCDPNLEETMLSNCFLHAVRLLDIAQTEGTEIFDSDLFSALLKQVLALFESVRASDPLKKDWITWLEMTDDEIVQDAVTVGAIGLALVFLVTKRSWPGAEVENDFKRKAHAWIVELMMSNNLEKAEIALRNLGCNPVEHFREACRNTSDPLLRDILMDHLNEMGLCDSEEVRARDFIRQIEGALSANVKRRYTFDCKMTVSAQEEVKALSFKLSPYNGSIDLVTLLSRDDHWRDEVITEVYFNTGDVAFGKDLKKETCWRYLLEANQIDLLLRWIDISFDSEALPLLNKGADYFTKSVHGLFAEWPITEDMLDAVIAAKCMATTKASVLDTCALYGVFAGQEKRSLERIVSRMENQSKLSCIRTILANPTSNVAPRDFDEMIYAKCMEHSLKPVMFICMENSESLSDHLNALKTDSSWAYIWRLFISWNDDVENRAIFKRAITESLRVYGCKAEELPFINAAVALLSEREISDVIESEGKDCSLLQLPLMDVNWQTAEGARKSKSDVTLYDLMANSKISVDKIFLWQSNNKNGTASVQDVSLEFPHFNHQILGIRFGFRQNLDHIYYLKQGRPSFACNLFVVDSLRTQRRLTTKMIKRVCGLAHGMALRCWKNHSIGNACVAFIAMLGDIAAANVLRVHLSVIERIHDSLPKSTAYYISTLARGIVAKDVHRIQEMAWIAEKSAMESFGDDKSTCSFEKWYLPVSFCNIHSLPLPSLLLKHLAKNHEWFPFVICMDVFKYPYDQAIDLIEEMGSKILKSHLIRAVTRTTLKLSTTSPTKTPPKIVLEPESTGKDEQANSKDAKDIFHLFVTNIYTEVLNTIQTFTDRNIVLPWSCEQDPDSDVLLTLLKCESEADASRSLLVSSIELQSPPLSVFATCFQSDSIFPNLIAWLVSSIPTSLTRIKRREEGQQLVDRIYSSKEMETLLVNFFSTGYFQTFFRGMNLFMPENPVTLFLSAVYHSVFFLDFDAAAESLKEFVTELSHFPTKEPTGFFSKAWVLNVVGQCIGNLLTRSDLQSSIKRRFLRVLADSDLSSVDSSFPNYLIWSQICEILECSEANLNFVQLYDITSVAGEVSSCLDVLTKNCQFTQALEICSLLSLNRDQCVILMWRHQLMSSVQSEPDVQKVWKNSSLAFKDENVNPNLAASFYYDMASSFQSDSSDRYFALKYCLLWRLFIDDTLSASFKEESDVIELEKWKCCLKRNFDVSLLTNGDSVDLTQALLINVWSSAKVLVRSEALEDFEKLRVETLINIFLDQGDLAKAFRLSAFFKSDNQDLMIAMTCLKMAHDEILPADATKLTVMSSGLSKQLWLERESSQAVVPSDQRETRPALKQNQILALLDKQIQAVKHGKTFLKKVLACYRLAVNLDSTFKDVACERDYLSILSRSAPSEGVHTINVVADLITMADLSPIDLSKFLKDKIVSAVLESQLTDLVVPVTLWGVPLDSGFRAIYNLLENPSLLGSELLQASTTLPCGPAVEILIKAHDCFTVSCNVEGIGRVLRRARILASLALQEERWQYLVRLLVGMERYADMSYIFQMLKDNGQFEQLLRKGMHKVPALHVAISEFLQRHCPEDRELSKMVAAHFGLHAKLAHFWLDEAEEIISKLPLADGNVLKDTSKARQMLGLAVENYSHAIHWFLQAGQLNKALKVGHKAQVVAIQISLIGSSFVLRLKSPSEFQTLLNDGLSVAQGIIISRAYDFEPDWTAALHARWILKGDKTFFADLKSSSILSPQTVRGYALRFGGSEPTNGKARERMKNLMGSLGQATSPLNRDLVKR